MRISCSRNELFASLIILIGVLARIVVVFLSDGSNDVRAWSDFASLVAGKGVCACYSEVAACNHPPVSLLSSVGVRHVALLLQIPFSIVFKFSSLLAELFTMVCLYRFLSDTGGARKRLLLLSLYAFSPLPILVTAFHGNTDAAVLVHWNINYCALSAHLWSIFRTSSVGRVARRGCPLPALTEPYLCVSHTALRG